MSSPQQNWFLRTFFKQKIEDAINPPEKVKKEISEKTVEGKERRKKIKSDIIKDNRTVRPKKQVDNLNEDNKEN